MYRYGDMCAKQGRYIGNDMGVYQIIYENYRKTIILLGEDMCWCLDRKLFWMYPNGKYIPGNNDYFPISPISVIGRKWRIYLQIYRGNFWPEKPIFPAFFGVVHPPTPHLPILAPSVSKFTHPKPELNVIPTPQQKFPNRLRFSHIIYSYIE